MSLDRIGRPIVQPLLLLLLLLLAQTGLATGAAAQRRIDERRPATPDGLLRIHNLVGAVRIIGWDRDTIAVTGTIGSGTFYMGVGKGGGKLGVDLPAAMLEARIDLAPDKTSIVGSMLEVRVPRGTRVWVKTASADIEVDGVTGGLDLYAVGGAIRIRGAPQDIHAESMDGTLDLDVTTPVVRARSAGGAITLRGDIENAVASSVGGAITIESATLQRGRFESVTGAIHWTGDVERGSSLSFESHAGPVVLAVPETVSAEFDVTAFNADIRNEIARVIPRLGGDLRSRMLTFTMGEGAAQVTVRSFKGTVSLLRRND